MPETAALEYVHFLINAVYCGQYTGPIPAYGALRMRHLSRLLSILLTLSGISLHADGAEAPAKIVFISGKPSHGPGAHEHRAGNLLLAKRLKEADLNLELIVLPEDGYPKDPAVLKDAATIVVFCTGHQKHLLNPKLEEFDALMKKGTGVVMIHWATEAEIGMPGKKFLEWMGGFCDLNWSVNPHWKPAFNSFPDHPISRGLTPFGLDDEWYYHMRFVPEMKGVTPILSALPGPETLKRPDGERSGNPDVRKAVANGEKQHVAWAYDRPDGKGRGFGFTGAHNHKSWQDDNFRRIVLNAILWTAHVEVPENGVASKTPTTEEIKQNLDDKSNREKPKPKAIITKPESINFAQLREKKIRRVDSKISLELLTKTLASTDNVDTQLALLKGILTGLEGRRNVGTPKNWGLTKEHLSKSGNAEVATQLQRLGQIFGDREATQRAIALVRDTQAPTDSRRDALKSLITQKAPELKAILPALLDDSGIQIDAIRAYSAIEDPKAANLLISRFSKMNPGARIATIETLATRETYATSFLAALKSNKIPKAEIPAYVARNLTNLLGNKFTDFYGDIKALSEDKAKLITKYQKLLTPERLSKADPHRGRLIFQTSCSVCHKLYETGGVIGPDLTGSNRADLNYILLNMIDPSADIPDAYKLVTITSKSGEILTGTLSAEDDQKVTLNLVGQNQIVLKSDIASRDVSPYSMMPEGLLPTLQDEQVLDLVKYLQTTKEVELPK